MRFVLAGGGTGGHIVVGLALAEASRASGKDHSFLFLLPSGRPQPFSLPENSRAVEVDAASPFRSRFRSLPAAVPAVFRGFLASRRAFKAFGPDVVVGMGGYTSVPGILAAARLRIPAVIQEQNRRPGRANRFLSRFSAAIALGFPLESDFFPARRTFLTGIPLRPEVQRPAPPDIPAGWGWKKEDPSFRVLVAGGSAGASFINGLLGGCARLWGEEGKKIGFIHLAGSGEDEVRAAYRAAGLRSVVFGFHERMGALYSLADLLVARAGALTLAEAAWWGLPMILVPYPSALDDHQRANARYFADAGAARWFDQEELTPERLVREVLEIKNAPGRRRLMSKSSRALSSPRAAEKVLDLIERIASSGYAGGEPEPVSAEESIKARRYFAFNPVSDSASSAPPTTDHWSFKGAEPLIPLRTLW